MPPNTFKSKLSDPKNNGTAYITIPFNVKEEFGIPFPRVKAEFNKGLIYHGRLVDIKGKTCLLIRKDVREHLDLDYGDSIDVKLDADLSTRKFDIPIAFKVALIAKPKCYDQFNKLHYTKKIEFISYIQMAKRPETQTRRIQKLIKLLEKENYQSNE